MKKLLETALVKVGVLFAREDIDPVDLPTVLEGLAQARRGEYASATEVEAAFRAFDS
jgi:hypothetical protein